MFVLFVPSNRNPQARGIESLDSVPLSLPHSRKAGIPMSEISRVHSGREHDLVREAEDQLESYTVSRIERRQRRRPPPRVEGPADLYRLLKPLLAHQDREHFYAVLLSTKNHVLAVELVSVGSLSASLVHPREVFKPAILRSAAAIAVAHNHPSNLPDPSPEDTEFTRRLARAGELLGIRLLDHLIVCDESYVSLREAGHLVT